MSKKMRPGAKRQPRAARLAGDAQERSNAAPAAGSVSENDFAALVLAHRLTGTKTIDALRAHLVAGKSRARAAAAAGINASAITRAAHKFERDVCPECGRPLGER